MIQDSSFKKQNSPEQKQTRKFVLFIITAQDDDPQQKKMSTFDNQFEDPSVWQFGWQKKSIVRLKKNPNINESHSVPSMHFSPFEGLFIVYSGIIIIKM